MIDIFVIEDDPLYQNLIHSHLCEIITMLPLPCNVHSYTPEAFSASVACSPHQGTRVYFIDILFDGPSNGIQMAQEIRKVDKDGYIIFVTGHLQFAITVFQYRLKALDFIYKGAPDFSSRLKACMETVVEETQFRNASNEKKQDPSEQKLNIQLNSVNVLIPYSEIIYFEANSFSRKITVTTSTHRHSFLGTIKELTNTLDARFILIHRAIIINTKYVKEICTRREDPYILLHPNHKCPIASRRIRDVYDHVMAIPNVVHID